MFTQPARVAEAAIKNPLLDDVNLEGANGILVNITSGPDITMAEFDEIGRAIENYASDDATVVIGTTIDANMQDEIRVTLVAAGLNRGRSAARKPTFEVIENTGLRTGTDGYVAPTFNEPQQTSFGQNLTSHGNAGFADTGSASSGAASFQDEGGYLDIPAFLRRQAD